MKYEVTDENGNTKECASFDEISEFIQKPAYTCRRIFQYQAGLCDRPKYVHYNTGDIYDVIIIKAIPKVIKSKEKKKRGRKPK